MPETVTKRNGTVVPFDATRIERAVRLCLRDVKEIVPEGWVKDLVSSVVWELEENPSVEYIQDQVETALMKAGKIEAARSYIRYRDEHARMRSKAPIDSETRAAFDESAAYFPTPLRAFQFYDKYSRYDYTKGRRETWVETVDRTVNFLRELSNGMLDGEVYERIRTSILNAKAMPSMRLLAMAGEAARRNNMAIFNCLSGDTTVVTRQGVRRLKDLAGTTGEVVTPEGWKEATFNEFGSQKLQRITLVHWNGGKHGNYRVTIRATENHRWVLRDNTVTDTLSVGDILWSEPLPTLDVDRDGLRHGFVFADGTLNKQKSANYAQIRLCGEKAEQLGVFTEAGMGHSYPPSCSGDPMVYCGKHENWKELPDSDANAAYIAGFIKGWLLFDGSKAANGNVKLGSINEQAIDWLVQHVGIAGLKIISRRVDARPTNYGPRTRPLHTVIVGEGAAALYRVEEIEPDGTEPVFCATEPETQTFLLANGQLTGNCAYLPVDRIMSFVEAMSISMAGCGVGYSVEQQYVDMMPGVSTQSGMRVHTHQVEDTTEGWMSAYHHGLVAWFSGGDLNFDYSLIRPFGAPLRVKGGRASGPAPLKTLLDTAREIILKAQGRRLTALECHRIMCLTGSASIAGGVRRTAMIALFTYGDHGMTHCKEGNFPQELWNANNSAVMPDRWLSQAEMAELFTVMHASRRGEPGLFSRKAAIATKPIRRKTAEFGVNPCSEAILRPRGLCNLSSAVCREDDTLLSLKDKVEVATIIATIQSMATHFPGLNDEWRINAEEERLLIVDLNGQLDCPLVQQAWVQSDLADLVVEVNQKYAKLLGINAAAATTGVKPSGNSSTLLDCSSGLHARHAPYYIRNVRVSASSPIFKVLRDAGVPLDPENGQLAETATTWVAHFPVKSPSKAIFRAERTALDQCEYWLQVKENWCEHTASITVTYGDDELLDIAHWAWKHQDVITGMSFLPRDDVQYAQMPYTEITPREYEQLAADFPTIDFAKITAYEGHTDMTTASQEVACVAGICELV
jgi:ribonucleoside-diphosphate reductase alpha chain